MDKHQRLVRLSDTELTVAEGETDVRNMKVVDEAGEEIGTAEHLYIDPREGRVRFLEVRFGDILGLGGSTTLIPVEAVRRVDDRVHLGHGRQAVVAAPPYDPRLEQEPDWGEWYAYYGYPAYWSVASPPYGFRPR